MFGAVRHNAAKESASSPGSLVQFTLLFPAFHFFTHKINKMFVFGQRAHPGLFLDSFILTSLFIFQAPPAPPPTPRRFP